MSSYHMLTLDQVAQIFEILLQENPNPKTELIAPNDYAFAIAVLLSAQSTDKAVNKATKELFKIADTPEKMLNLGFENLRNYIKTIGLFNNKAKYIIELSGVLVSKFNSRLPKSISELERLPGIGRKSARVIANTLYNEPVIAVDTHVFRVSRRLGITNANIVKKVEIDLETLVPQLYKVHASNLLVLHGRYVCLAKKPKCSECKLNKICEFAHTLDKG